MLTFFFFFWTTQQFERYFYQHYFATIGCAKRIFSMFTQPVNLMQYCVLGCYSVYFCCTISFIGNQTPMCDFSTKNSAKKFTGWSISGELWQLQAKPSVAQNLSLTLYEFRNPQRNHWREQLTKTKQKIRSKHQDNVIQHRL